MMVIGFILFVCLFVILQHRSLEYFFCANIRLDDSLYVLFSFFLLFKNQTQIISRKENYWSIELIVNVKLSVCLSFFFLGDGRYYICLHWDHKMNFLCHMEQKNERILDISLFFSNKKNEKYLHNEANKNGVKKQLR